MFCYTKWRGWVVEFQASVCQVMGGGKCSVWGWDLYCSLHYTTIKSLWLPNPNVCEDSAASHSGSQTISLSERQPAVLYPMEASNLSSCLCCKTTVPIAKPALGWLAEMDQFSFLICLCDRRKQQEGEMETKRTQVCTELYRVVQQTRSFPTTSEGSDSHARQGPSSMAGRPRFRYLF